MAGVVGAFIYLFIYFRFPVWKALSCLVVGMPCVCLCVWGVFLSLLLRAAC